MKILGVRSVLLRHAPFSGDISPGRHDALPHDLADPDDEDLVNVDDDDGVELMLADVARGHGGDVGGDDRPPTHHIPTRVGVAIVNASKNFWQRHPKTQFGWKESGLAAYPSRDLEPREEMLRLQALGSNTESGVPYTKEEINALARKGKQRWHLPGVGRVLPGRATDVLIPPPPQCTHNSADVEKLKKKNKYLTKQVNLMMKLFRSDDKFSQMLTQYESTPEFGNANGSGGCGDDEMADDEDGDEDEDDEEDSDS
ncbi:hypothetical protein Tco_0453484 [Tanacetum coccineum]